MCSAMVANTANANYPAPFILVQRVAEQACIYMKKLWIV